MIKLFIITILLASANILYGQQNCVPDYAGTIKRVSLSDSVNIAYIEKGTGKTIVFIHGLGGNLSHWQKSITQLSKKYRCIALDLPGYGCSTLKNTVTSDDQLNDYANIIIEFFDKLKLKEITLVGHSMGGQIAIITALKLPSKIKKLVLLAPAGFETFTTNEKELLAKISTPAFFKEQDEAAIRTSFKNNFYQQPADAEALIQYRIELKKCSVFNNYCNTIVNGINGILYHPVQSQLANIKQKVLVIFGEEDKLIPNKYLHPSLTTLQVANDGAKLIKNSSLVMIPKAGHLLQYEIPDAFNTAITNFLK